MTRCILHCPGSYAQPALDACSHCLLSHNAQTAATLHDQTNQLNKVVDDLNEIEFTMKKASKVIADITKGLMTDRCAELVAGCDVSMSG